MAATDRIAAEHEVLTTASGIVDRSERGKLALTGSEAKAFLTGQVTNDVEALEPGTGCYATLLTHKGKMEGDLRILDLGPPSGELFLDTERLALQALFDRVRRFKIGFDAELHKRTLERALLSLVGPRSREAAGADAADLPSAEHANRPAEIAGHAVVLVTTDLGVDVLCDADARDAVHAALVEAGARPVSDEAAEVVRVESGRPRYGADLDDSVIPQEAGLNERAVSFTKGCYVGQETVARLHYKGKPNRHLRGLRLSDLAESGTPLHLGGREVGQLRSVVLSPTHGPIALALVRREAAPGDTIAVGDGGITAEVVDLPF
jgi:folate-binding protein YgfZ